MQKLSSGDGPLKNYTLNNDLDKENRMLKELLVEKELEGRLKDEALKKKYLKNKKVKFYLNISYQKLSGNMTLRKAT